MFWVGWDEVYEHNRAPRKQHPCSYSSMGCSWPCCLQVLTQALAGSGIKGVETQAAVAGKCPRGVGAELAAVVQALGTLVNVWWWGREWGYSMQGESSLSCCWGVSTRSLHCCTCVHSPMAGSKDGQGQSCPGPLCRASSWHQGREGFLSSLPIKPQSRVDRNTGTTLHRTAQQLGLIDRIQFIEGVLWERGWKTEQGPTPNSGVNTLKNRVGGTLLCQGWGGGPHRREGDRQSTHVAGQTSRHMVQY